jgi:hypothetical protein
MCFRENLMTRNGFAAIAFLILLSSISGTSRQAWARDAKTQHWCLHRMFHVPKTDDASWEADLEGSPVLYNNENRDVPETETIFMIPVFHWSDGTPAPHQESH